MTFRTKAWVSTVTPELQRHVTAVDGLTSVQGKENPWSF